MKSKYKQIFEHYSSLIEGEKLRPGESLPPEREIMEEFGVSRDTVRKAMQLLEQNKYISKKRGRESIVRAEGRLIFLSRGSYRLPRWRDSFSGIM